MFHLATPLSGGFERPSVMRVTASGAAPQTLFEQRVSITEALSLSRQRLQ
jgi:hypothetical protein